MRRNAEEINLALALCFQDLREIALADGVITKDERAILDEIEKDFNNLEEQLVQVLASDLDLHEFNDLANDFLLDIVHKTVHVAEEDNVVTRDEDSLIQKLKEFVHKEGMFHE